MNKKKLNVVTIGFIAVIVLAAGMLMINSLHRSAQIVLPETASASSDTGDASQQSGDALSKIEITPNTVQAAVATLTRPKSYVRSLTVETIWSGGSASTTSVVTVTGRLTRTDTTQISGRVRHAITDGESTYIWYDSASGYYKANAGDISADEEQRIPTYEDLLNLKPEQIDAADYRTFSEESCIYAETAVDGDGNQLRYWVSVDSGLLVGAEKLKNGETIYRMSAQGISEVSAAEETFTLPDGTGLLPKEH